MKLEFSGQIFKKMPRYQCSWKSDQWETSRSMRTDMAKLIVAFSDFANDPKSVQLFFIATPLTEQGGADIIRFRFSIGQTWSKQDRYT